MSIDDIIRITVPKETVNDDGYTIRELPISSGDEVRRGDIVAVLETSKAIFDIEATQDGYLFYTCKIDQIVTVGATIAWISKRRELPKDIFSEEMVEAPSSRTNTEALGSQFTKRALDMIRRSGIDPGVFVSEDVVTTDDVKRYLAKLARPKLGGAVPDVGQSISENSIVVIGGGGHAKMCIDILRRTNSFDIYGILDPAFPIGHKVLDAPVVGDDDDLETLFQRGVKSAVVGIGAANSDLTHREKLIEKLKSIGYTLPNILHPTAIVEESAKMGFGNQLMAGCIVGSNVTLKEDNIINSGAIVSHDCVIGDNVHIAPGAILGGAVTVRSDALVGMGAAVYFGCEIGEHAVITNGVQVFEDVPAGKRVLHPRR